MKNKSLEITRVRMGSSSENAALRERVAELERVLSELTKSIEIDLLSIDLDNFSDYGVGQIEEKLSEVNSEVI